jgi:hypothetical protein
MEEEKQSFFSRFKNVINSIIWDLPFDNYHKLYKTGIIKNMDIEQKKQIIFKENNLLLRKIFFSRLVKLRPSILDDEDLIEFNKTVERKKYDTIYLIIGFMGLNSYTFYTISIKRKQFLGKFLLINAFLILFYLHNNQKQEKFIEKMFIKYDKIIVNEEMDEKLKLILNKESYEN